MDDPTFDGAGLWLDDEELDFSTPRALTAFESPTCPSQRRQSKRTGAGSQILEINQLSTPYTITWILSKKKGRLFKLTENAVQNIDEYPSVFWHSCLKAEIEMIIKEKRLDHGYEPEETRFVFSINARSEKAIPKRFPGLQIDWNEVDGQVDNWSDLRRDGKKLSIEINFIYKENEFLSRSAGTGGRNGGQRQRAELAAMHDQDGNEITLWEKVYDLFECPGAGCDVGPYCWRNPETGTRVAISNATLSRLITFVEKGGKLDEHKDVPKHLQNEILNPPTKRKQPDGNQINITNLMPGAEPKPKRIKVTGPRDVAIDRYRDWHCEQVVDPGWKKQFHNIAALTFKACLSLEEIAKARKSDEDFFVSQKVSRGIVRQWMGMVEEWAAPLPRNEP